MYSTVQHALVLGIALLFLACGGSDSSSELSSDEPFALADTVEISDTQFFRVLSPTSCLQEYKNRFIYQVMHDSYLWAESVNELDYTDSNYTTSEIMLEALKTENDNFSFIIDAETAQDFFEEGKNNNFGMGLKLQAYTDTDDVLVISFVYPDSPADNAGFKRGDVIQLVEGKSINDESFSEIVEILENQTSTAFTFLKEDKTTYSQTITKQSYSIETVLYDNVFVDNTANKRVGYLVFQNFIENALVELDTVFEKFKEANTNELILDLRYNGGGAVNVANHLSSLIAGSNVSDNVFHKTLFNDSYSNYNTTTYFESENNNSLGLNRVFVITTPSTCSSSELVINALSASANNVEVIQIGGETCGKPYGYLGAGMFCDKALYAINVESQNGDGIGNYTNGLTPTCEASDDYMKDFGDRDESSLNEALHYISTGSCSTNASKSREKVSKKINELKLPNDGFKRVMGAY